MNTSDEDIKAWSFGDTELLIKATPKNLLFEVRLFMNMEPQMDSDSYAYSTLHKLSNEKRLRLPMDSIQCVQIFQKEESCHDSDLQSRVWITEFGIQLTLNTGVQIKLNLESVRLTASETRESQLQEAKLRALRTGQDILDFIFDKLTGHLGRVADESVIF